MGGMMFWQRYFVRWVKTGIQILVLLCIVTSLLFFTPQYDKTVQAQPTGYQEYYVLGYEEHVWRAFRAIKDNHEVDGKICSTVSLVATADYQVVYYDHWEDGYEADLVHPVQSTTEIYGDGDPENGGSGDDILYAGDDINLTSDQGLTGESDLTGYVPVDTGRDPAYLRYDGGDHIFTSGSSVALSHAMWPFGNSQIGGAWEVYSQQAYAGAYSYDIPIGEDLYHFGGGDTGTYGDFRNVYLQLSAFEDNTTVSINNGVDVVNLTLDRGQTYASMGYIDSESADSITINAGTTIHTSKPTQVGLMTGSDSSSGFQGRFIVVLPEQQWGADYVVPVPSGNPGDEAEIYLSNPNDFEITINAYDKFTQTTFAISPTTFISATIPYSKKRGGEFVGSGSAARFISPDGVFGVVVAADTSGTNYDWGFAGIPAKYLTADYYVPWAPGDANTPPQNNGSPVWVTPLADDTTFFVDYSPLDGDIDDTFTLDVLDQRRIFDPDNDNTGMHVWATGNFAVVWGEDPGTAGASIPYLDLGLATPSLQERWLNPVFTLDKTAEPTILPPQGGTVTFTLEARSHSAPLVDVSITDDLPQRWSYVPGSSRVTYPDGSTGALEPTVDGRELSWDFTTGLDLDQILELTFQAWITDTVDLSASVNQAEAQGRHEYSDAIFNPRDETTVYIGPLNLVKSVSSGQAKIGDTLVYTLSYANLSEVVTATDVLLRDVLPVQYVEFQSASDEGTYNPTSGTIVWDIPSIPPGGEGAVNFTVEVKSFVEEGTVIKNVGYIEDAQQVEAGSNVARTTVLAPDVQFTKSGPPIATPGEVITYLLSYENIGGVAATGVIIHDVIPDSTSYTPGSLAINDGSGWQSLTDEEDEDQGYYDSLDAILYVELGRLDPGEAGQISFAVRVDEGLPSGSTVRNWATFNRDMDIPRQSNLMVTQLADLSVDKSAQPNAVSPGGLLTYTLTYKNASDTVTQTQVYVREQIPAYTTLISATTPSSDQFIEYSYDNAATWTSTRPVTPVTHIRWHDEEMGPRVQETVGLVVRVDSDLPPDATLQNIAYVKSEETMEYINRWIPSNQVEVGTVDLWVKKAVELPLAEGSSARVGDPLSYTISYGNHGSADAVDVQIFDTIPEGTTYIDGTAWGVGADASGAPDLVWNVGIVEANVSEQRVGYAVSSEDLVPESFITNTAVLNSIYGVKISEPVTVTFVPEADLSITKDDALAVVKAGESVTYTLRYTNTGPSVAQDLRITDTLPFSVTYGGLVTSTLPLNMSVNWGGDPARQRIAWYTPTLRSQSAATTSQSFSGTIVFTATVDPGADGVIVNDVVITSTTYDPDPADNVGADSTEINTEADLALHKSAASGRGTEVAAGMPVTYTLVYTNLGPSDTSNLIVTDTLPSNVAYGGMVDKSTSIIGPFLSPGSPGEGDVITWHDLDVNMGDSGAIIFTVTVDADASGVITNEAYVDASTYDPFPINNSEEVSTTVVVEADLWIDKNVTGLRVGGGELTYTISYANAGPSQARDVVITDVLPAGLAYVGVVSSTMELGTHIPQKNQVSWYTETLAPGAAGNIVFTVTVAPQVYGVITNGVSITGTTYDPYPGGNHHDELTIISSRADLSIDKTSPVTSVVAGKRLTYTLVYTNDGPSDTRELFITDTLPAGVVYGGLVSSTAEIFGPTVDCTPGPCTLTWYTPTLPVGSGGKLVFTVTVGSGVLSYGKNIFNHVYILSSASSDPRFSNNTASQTTYAIGETDLSIDKSMSSLGSLQSSKTVTAGTDLTCTLTYTNAGPSDAREVVITDVLPLGMTFDRVLESQFSAPVVIEEGDPARQVVSWYTPTVKAGDTDTVVFVASVDPGASGMVTNSVSITTFTNDLQPGDNGDSEAVTITVETDLAVEKFSTRRPPVSRDVLTYTLVYTNHGPSHARDVVVTDTLPSGVTWGGVSDPHYLDGPTTGWSGDPSRRWLRWSAPMLEAGASDEIIITVTVDLEAGAVITNDVVFTAATYDPDGSNNVDMDVGTVAAEADLVISKWAPEAVSVNPVLTYTLAYTNAGPSVAQDVVITDLLPASVIYGGLISTTGGISEPDLAWVGDPPQHELSWYVGGLSPHESGMMVFTVTVAPDADRIISNRAFISSSASDPCLDNNSDDAATFTSKADLVVSKFGPSSVMAGDELTYTLVYTNVGPSDAEDTFITDTLPPGLGYGGIVHSSPHFAAPTVDCLPVTCKLQPATCNLQFAICTLSWYTSALPADTSGVIIFTATAASSVEGSITNHVVITSAAHDPLPVNNLGDISSTVTTEADLAIVKSASASAVAGMPLTYTLLYTNLGPSDAEHIVITDTLPVSVTYGGWVTSSAVLSEPVAGLIGNPPQEWLRWSAPSLGSGASDFIIFTATVDVGISGTLTNEAVISGARPDPVYTNDAAAATTWIRMQDELCLVGAGFDLNGSPLYPGDEIEYQVWVTNTRTYEQEDVIVAGSAPRNTTLLEGSVECSPDAICRLVGSIDQQGGLPRPQSAGTLAPQDFGGTAVASINELAPGDVLTLTYRVRVNDGVSSIGGSAVVMETQNQEPQEMASVYLPSGNVVDPGLQIIKTALDLNGAPLWAGDGIKYNVVVTNASESYAQSNIIVSDTAPTGTRLIEGSVECACYDCAASCGGSGRLVTATVAGDPSAHFSPGDVLSLTFQVSTSVGVSSIGGNIAAVDSENQNRQETALVYPPGSSAVSCYQAFLPIVLRMMNGE